MKIGNGTSVQYSLNFCHSLVSFEINGFSEIGLYIESNSRMVAKDLVIVDFMFGNSKNSTKLVKKECH